MKNHHVVSYRKRPSQLERILHLMIQVLKLPKLLKLLYWLVLLLTVILKA